MSSLADFVSGFSRISVINCIGENDNGFCKTVHFYSLIVVILFFAYILYFVYRNIIMPNFFGKKKPFKLSYKYYEWL
jgi:hypothetical protein